VAELYKNATGSELSTNEAKTFAQACPPAKAMLYAVGMGQYHWGLRDAREEDGYKAGMLDLFSATYLPFCDQFVTKDRGQHNALKRVAEGAGLSTEIRMYAEFRRGLLLIAA
jgi:hypothetical protein